MAHLLKIRKGWENENLARFILSKFSFISQPATIADDLGTDFFCTFFEKVSEERKTKKGNITKDIFIYPKHSFAIQIKSSRRRFDITNKIGYFNNLEMPFFVGVVNQQKLSATIYSGDVIPELFSLVGLSQSNKIPVKAVLLENREYHGQKPRQTKYIVPFFRIGEIFASGTEEDLRPFIESFSEICLNYRQNIISKTKKEYLFHDAVTLEPMVIYGSGSYRVCRDNFIERFAEVLCNLAWAAPQLENKEKFMQEYNLYKKLYFQIEKIYGNNIVLEGCFHRLEDAVKSI